jgi:hypothetical protein
MYNIIHNTGRDKTKIDDLPLFCSQQWPKACRLSPTQAELRPTVIFEFKYNFVN